MNIEEKVLQFNNEHQLFVENSTILVAVSGGPDSLALLHFLNHLKTSYHLKLIALSLDHELRGEKSKKDLAFVKQICSEWKIEFFGESINVPQYIEKTKKSTELAAREMRYRYFQKEMEKFQNPILAMGHHGDDQVETMFMQLMRGQKPKGMPFKRPFANGHIVRPFLCLTKDEILHYCQSKQLNPCIDETNNETIYTRNAFRHQLIPFLKKFNPNIHMSLQNRSEVIQEEEQYLNHEAKKVVKKIAHFAENKKKVHINKGEAILFHQTLQRRAFHLILNYLYEHVETDIQSTHVDHILNLIHHEKPNAFLNLPNGLKVIREYDTVTFTFEETERSPYLFEILPGDMVKLPNGMDISLMVDVQQRKPEEWDHYEYICDASNIAYPILVRNRKNGDKIKVRGLGGQKKVKDIFIDEKIPLKERDLWPIVTDSNGKLLWIVGLKKGEVTESQTPQKWLRLKVR